MTPTARPEGRSRFLITSWPVVSHFHPLVGIAIALRDRGHDVAFYCGEAAGKTLEAASFKLFPFSRVDTATDNAAGGTLRAVASSIRMQSPRQQYRAFRGWVVDSIPDQVGDLQRVVEEWKPDVIVTEAALLAPIVVLRELAGIPVALASQFMGPLLPGPDAIVGFGFAPPRTLPGHVLARAVRGTTDLIASGLRRRVDQIRASYGLPALGSSVLAATGRVPLYLVGSLPELDYNRRDLPPSVRYVGPYLWQPPAPASSGWLDTLPSANPWVHVSEGTSHFQDPFVLRAATQGLAGRPVEVVMATGRDRDPGALGLASPAANVHVTQWLNYDDLLPRCSVVVTTGGTGTVLAALQAGVPLVVVPVSWDQPDNARRVVEAGAGVRVMSRRCTPERMRSAVEEVLRDGRYREAAARIGKKLRDAQGASRAAELLESLATGRLTAASP